MGRTWITDIRTWDAPDPVDDGVGLLADALSDLVPESGTRRRSDGAGDASAHAAGRLRPGGGEHRAAARRGRDGDGPARAGDQVGAEIEKIRATCGIADRAFARVPEFAGAGRPLAEVFRDFQIALLEEGADWVSYVAGGAGPGGYGDVISPADGRPLASGDVLMLDTGAVRDGYFCDFDRNYAIGRADDAARRAHAALYAATETALDGSQARA